MSTSELLYQTRARAGALALALGWEVTPQEVAALGSWIRDWQAKHCPAPAAPAPWPGQMPIPPKAPRPPEPRHIGTLEELRYFMSFHGVPENSWRVITHSPTRWDVTVPAKDQPRIQREVSLLDSAGHIAPRITLHHFQNTNPCDICKRSHFTQDHKDNE